MTLIGKILVMIQLGFSLVLATLAFALYTNRIDWTATQAKGDQAAGLLAQREQEYKDVCANALRPSDTRYRADLVQVQAREFRRPGELAWYASELQHLKTQAGDPKWCQRVKRDDKKQLPIPRNPTAANPSYLEMEAPVGLDGKPIQLHALLYYIGEPTADGKLDPNSAIAKTLKNIETKLDETKKLAVDEQTFTTQLAGDKGIHNRTRDEKFKKNLVVQEYKDLKPEWINAMVELSNLEQLRTRLTERIADLGGKPLTTPITTP